MKKLIIGALALTLILAVCAGTVLAYEPSSPDCAYIDADGDGICDNCSITDCPQHHGRNYVDADNNGVCDNCPKACIPQHDNHHARQNGCSGGQSYGHGHGHGCRR